MATPQARLQRWLKNWLKLPALAFVPHLQRAFPSAEIYLVGGMVRDLALGRPSKDYDLVVGKVPAKHLEAALGKLGAVDLVGKTFGVFKFTPRGVAVDEPIDVALPRKEHAFGTGGYRDVEVQSDPNLPIEDDLARRDFTINAMALRLSPLPPLPHKGGREIVPPNGSGLFSLSLGGRGIKGEGETNLTPPPAPPLTKGGNKGGLVDPFDGLRDLQKKTIRCVGNPTERFREDYSRILRAIRLACQLDFEIAAATWAAARQSMQHLNDEREGQRIVPYEVIARELVKALTAHPGWSLELLDESGALKLLMPELLKMKGCPQPPQFHTEGDVWTHTVLALGKLGSAAFRREFPRASVRPELVWAVLFHDIGKPPTLTVTDRIRTNGHDIKGAHLFRAVAERLKLASAGLNVEAVEQVIAKHLLPSHAKKSEMKETTIEKYFYSDRFPGTLLLQLIFVDISATIPPSGRQNFSSYRVLQRRIRSLRRRLKAKRQLPPDLLDGHQIMALLNIPPGPKIKEVKEYLRELQLAGKIKTSEQAKVTVRKKFMTDKKSRTR